MADMHNIRVTLAHGFLVMARTDGSIPLNSRVLAKIDEADDEFIRRIVACVNACAGIETAALEYGNKMPNYLHNMLEQRDELFSRGTAIAAQRNTAVAALRKIAENIGADDAWPERGIARDALHEIDKMPVEMPLSEREQKLLEALKGMTAEFVGVDLTNAACHAGICSVHQCTRCTRIIAAMGVIADIEAVS